MIRLPCKTAMLSLYMFIPCLTLLPEPFACMIMICYHLVMEVLQDYNVSSAVTCLFIILLCYSLSLYPFTERYAQPYFFSCLIRQIRAEIREVFRTSSGPSDAGRNPPPVTIHTWLERFNKQKPHSFEKAIAPMVNTRTDADLSAAVQNALQTLLPQIRAEIREEFRTSSGPSDASENPPLATIPTWLERFNKQKPHSFEKATAPVDTEN
nr:hypothetical protein [Tanacetum cinerariifolium]